MTRHVRGQALVFLLPLLAVLAAAAWWTFEAGQAVTEKQRLRDAADAAALSAAVWQARTLNFVSTMNRAIIANEAVIAQSVSLRSWSAYMDRMLPGAAAITAYVPYLNAATSTLQRWWTAFDRALQPSLVALEATTGAVERDLA
ncbi:MAG: pilus assembly protein TadG-related protein, partial [Gammaproteobacteria bacterium]